MGVFSGGPRKTIHEVYIYAKKIEEINVEVIAQHRVYRKLYIPIKESYISSFGFKLRIWILLYLQNKNASKNEFKMQLVENIWYWMIQ